MKSIKIIFVSMVLGTLFIGTSLAAGNVLVVHSYHPGYQWADQINKAIVKELVVTGVKYQTVFMDTKRHGSEKFIKQAAQKVKRLIATYRPTVVIAVDDNAQTYVVADYVNNSETQFVFCGVNSEAAKYGYPASNVTGILERLYPDQTLRMLKAIMPKIKQVAVVSDDSPTTDSILPRFKKKVQDGKVAIPIREYAQPATFSQWQRTIIRLDQDGGIDALLIPLYHTVKKDGTDQSMAPIDVMRWTLSHTTKPVVGLWPFSVEDGAFFAVTVDPREHGRVAARMAIDIIGGKTAADIPMVVNQEGFVSVNLKNASNAELDANLQIEQFADQIIK